MSKYRYKDSGYKKRLKQEAASNAEKSKKKLEEAREAAVIFFDDSQSIDVRLEAGRKIGNITDPDQIKKSLSILKDKNLPEELRSYALSGIANQAHVEESILQEAIRAIEECEGSGKIASTAMVILQLAEISSPLLYEKNSASYKNALKTIIEKDNKSLRLSALETLALEKDDYAQRRLIESLEKKDHNFIAPEIAIQLLSYDLHADHFPLLRRIAKDAPNPIAKKEALRNLGNDEKAKDILVEVAGDGNEDRETRHAAVTALHSLHPEIATEHSKKIIIEEEGEHLDDLKTALLNTLIFHEKTPTSDKSLNLRNDITEEVKDDFVDKLSNMKGSSKSAEYNAMIDLYLEMKKR